MLNAAFHFLVNLPASELFVPTFREDGTDRKFRNVGAKSSDARILPKKQNRVIKGFVLVPCLLGSMPTF